MKQKVFGLGLHKTGTSTLAECLRILGYSVCPEDMAHRPGKQAVKGEYAGCLSLAAGYDAFLDSPWNYPDMYLLCAVAYPGAKFILTVRDRHKWFDSLMRWVASEHSESGATALQETLGCEATTENRAHAQIAYLDHIDRVIAYFDAIPGDHDRLLVVDWTTGHEWIKVCEFLGEPVPDVRFPHMLRYDPTTDSYSDDSPRLDAEPEVTADEALSEGDDDADPS